MIRRPPRSTLFPTRRSSDLISRTSRAGRTRPSAAASGARSRRWCAAPRSEEHTSELQSRLHLVCRLLLEKKKKKRMKTCFEYKEYNKNKQAQTKKQESDRAC